MQISKIFNGIEGVGFRAGTLTTFVRTFSCDLVCSYCSEDYCVKPVTDEDLTGYTVMTTEAILDEIAEYGNKHVSIIGGEPLLQKDLPELVGALLDLGYCVSIHTQGASSVLDFNNKLIDVLNDDSMLSNLQYCVDYKCPYSGMQDQMDSTNLTRLIELDSIVFKVADEADLAYVAQTLEELEPLAHVFVVPLNETIEMKTISDYLYQNKIKARVQLKLGDD